MRKSFVTACAVRPPVEVAPGTISSAFAVHSGHMAGLSPGRIRLSRCADTSVDAAPARRHAFPLVVLNESKRRMPELDKSSAIHLAEAVLHIGDGRTGNEQRSREF